MSVFSPDPLGLRPNNHTEAEIVKYHYLLGEAIVAREFYRAALLCLSLAKELLFAHSNGKGGRPIQEPIP